MGRSRGEIAFLFCSRSPLVVVARFVQLWRDGGVSVQDSSPSLSVLVVRFVGWTVALLTGGDFLFLVMGSAV